MIDQTSGRSAPSRDSTILIAVILFQAFCAAVFMVDVVSDMEIIGWGWLTDAHLLPELGATLGLVSGIAALSVVLVRILRRQTRMARGLSVAQGALHELMDRHFDDWGLTPSEQDVASFTIKGFSIAEIARMRGSAEATVKTHLNAIYRKSGVTGRGQLVSLLIEDLMGRPLVDGQLARVADAV